MLSFYHSFSFRIRDGVLHACEVCNGGSYDIPACQHGDVPRDTAKVLEQYDRLQYLLGAPGFCFSHPNERHSSLSIMARFGGRAEWIRKVCIAN